MEGCDCNWHHRLQCIPKVTRDPFSCKAWWLLHGEGLIAIPAFHLQSRHGVYNPTHPVCNLNAWLQCQCVITNKIGSLVILFVIVILPSIIPGYNHAWNP